MWARPHPAGHPAGHPAARERSLPRPTPCPTPHSLVHVFQGTAHGVDLAGPRPKVLLDALLQRAVPAGAHGGVAPWLCGCGSCGWTRGKEGVGWDGAETQATEHCSSTVPRRPSQNPACPLRLPQLTAVIAKPAGQWCEGDNGIEMLGLGCSASYQAAAQRSPALPFAPGTHMVMVLCTSTFTPSTPHSAVREGRTHQGGGAAWVVR